MSPDSEALLKQLFRDDAVAAMDDHFVRRVMRDLEARQRRRLLFDTVSLVAVMTVTLLMTLPVIMQLPALLAGLSAESASTWSPLMAALGHRTLMPALLFLLVLLVPFTLDRWQASGHRADAGGKRV